ncbi:MAG: cyclase family protein, partial [Gracilibacteraceae bacterium]|nr:cyclase family protein [Gracilibacteraceae bacterium]
MKIIDLTRLISEDMPVYPGAEQPKLTPVSSVAAAGFRETRLTMFSHTGTHMDAPAHVFTGRATLDSFPASRFIGRALVIDCRGPENGRIISPECLERQETKAEAADFLLFNTGWSRFWGREEYFRDYPVIGDDVARRL